jgi:hypothetical protein
VNTGRREADLGLGMVPPDGQSYRIFMSLNSLKIIILFFGSKMTNHDEPVAKINTRTMPARIKKVLVMPIRLRFSHDSFEPDR